MSQLRHYTEEIMTLLIENREARPEGFSEMDLQMHFADLPLLGLRKAVDQLESEGVVVRSRFGFGEYQVALAS